MQTITATVTHTPFTTAKLASVSMTDDKGIKFDAKAFTRMPQAMRALANAELGQQLQLQGRWETNPRNGFQAFVVEKVLEDELAPSEPLGYVPFSSTGLAYMKDGKLVTEWCKRYKEHDGCTKECIAANGGIPLAF